MVIRLNKAEDLRGWAPLPITDSASFIERSECLACGAPLAELAAITGEDGGRIRVGCCDACGYVGYLNVPSPAWLDDFYTKTWGGEKESTMTAPPTRTPKMSSAMKAVMSLSLPPSASFCEIGCGYGGALKQLQDAGYTKIVGMENSANRVRLAKQQVGAPVYQGGFESESVQQELRQHAPFDVIYSSHVVEHTHDPRAIIEKAAGLQAEGGKLVIALPNFVGEPTMSVLFFLPHLHSFTVSALGALFEHYGYRIVSTDRSTDEEVVIIAEKGPVSLSPLSGGYLAKAQEKIARELRVAKFPKSTPMLFSWDKKDASATRLAPAAGGLLLKLRSLFGQRGETRSVTLTRESDDTTFPITFPCGPHPILFYK